jgi:hypothetical protein
MLTMNGNSNMRFGSRQDRYSGQASSRAVRTQSNQKVIEACMLSRDYFMEPRKDTERRAATKRVKKVK